LIRFLYPQLLFGLLVIPLIILIYIYFFNKKNRDLERFANRMILPKITPSLSLKKQYVKALLITLSLFFLIVSLARPQFGTKMEVIKRKGIDLMIVLDVSKSMFAEDIAPNRLIRAKMEISKIIDRLQGDRVGLVIFSGIPFVQCPLTVDYAAAKLMLEIIHPDLIPVPGTNLSHAIELAQKAFVDTLDQKSKVMILISDGEDHQGEIEKIAQKAADKGIKIFTVGIGSIEGVPIPDYDKNGNKIGLKKDRKDNIVVTKLNEMVLEKIALLTDGKYLHASATDAEIHRIFEEIEKMDKQEYDAKKYSQYEERFYIPLAVSFFLLILEFLIPDKKRKSQLWRGRFEI